MLKQKSAFITCRLYSATVSTLKTLLILLYLGCTEAPLIEENTTDQLPGPIVYKPESTNESLSTITPCEDGFAGVYPCSGFDLIAHLPLSDFGSNTANDNWGWTDPETGIEYVLSGLDDGTAFISLENPEAPIYLGKLPSAAASSPWRDIKVFQHYAYIVSEAKDHGMQVFDLTRLRGKSEAEVYEADAQINDFGEAHNIAINEESAFAYILGSDLYHGGPVFIDLSNPLNPKIVGGYEEGGYTHDAQIVTYRGPDEKFQERELLFGANSHHGADNYLMILDITDKSNPELIQRITYENMGFTHQGYLTEDQRYFLLGDELDEVNYGLNTTTQIFDLSDLEAPKLHLTYRGQTPSIDHNGYVKGSFFYLANYTAGLRVLNLEAIEEKQIEEFGFFDTHPSHDDPTYNGVWNIYPFFESGIIAISDIDSGVFLVIPSDR
ncbi:MAG: choice-of-anchor B family protein [Flavobacteriaceae bacterium]